MTQELVIYMLITIALAYVAYRIYNSFKKNQACGKCELMKVAQKESK
jgi:uncharacterized membrane protein YebE (DUF533 family)